MSKIIDILVEKIKANSSEIDKWFAAQFKQNKALIYNSVDLRHSGFKIAPIDTNCFPAGFNNLVKDSKLEACALAAKFIEQNCADAKNILIIGENHTKNLRYLENLLALQEFFQTPQNKVAIGYLLEESAKIELEDGRVIELQSVVKNGEKISTIDGFEPEIVILNNDLTNGLPEILQNIDVPIFPTPNLGWFQRKKSEHFSIYNWLAGDFAKLIDVDPWLISSIHRQCDEIDFKKQIGTKCLVKYVDEVIAKLDVKYKQYGIDEKPYCYVKADNGTYGIAVMLAFSGQDILEINKKERNKMNMLKGNTMNSTAVIQEGIKTVDTIDGHICEPMIYMINGEVAGNLLRSNQQRDELISLNTAGMEFHNLKAVDDFRLNLGAKKDDVEKVYFVIAKLAALAAAKERY